MSRGRKCGGLHTRSEHLLSHFGDVSGHDKRESLILLLDSIFDHVQQVEQLQDEKNKLISVSEATFTHTVFTHLQNTSLIIHLSPLSEASTVQVLVEAAEHVVRCCSHLWIIAAQSHHGDSQSVAGYKLEAVDDTFCHTE